MSEEQEYTVKHIEYTGVDAESEADAREKAMSGMGYGWSTEEVMVKEVGGSFDAEPDFEIFFDEDIPSIQSERLEDAIKELLDEMKHFGFRGRLGSNITGNCVSFNVEKQESTDALELNESETDILRRGGSVEVGGQVITLDENAEDKHGLGYVV